MLDHNDNIALERLRGWGLVALYGSLGLFAVLLIFAGFRFLPAYEGDYILLQLAGMIIFGCFSVISCFLAARKIWQALKGNRQMPALALTPFAGILGTILIASYLFAAVPG